MDICSHYEAKCSGKYETLTSRYIFQMTKEILSQVHLLSESAKEDEKEFLQIKSTLAEWNDNFRDLCIKHGYKDTSQFNAIDVVPSLVKNKLLRQKEKIKSLESALIKSNQQINSIRVDMANELDKNVDVYRENAERERRQHKQIVNDLKVKSEKEAEQFRSTLKSTKQENAASLERIRQKAEEAIIKSENHRLAASSELKMKTAESKDTLTKEFEIERRRFLQKIKSIERREKESIQSLKTRLSHQHSNEISNLKRQLAIEKSRVHTERSRCAINNAQLNKSYIPTHIPNSTTPSGLEFVFECADRDVNAGTQCSRAENKCIDMQKRLIDLESLVHTLLQKLSAQVCRNCCSNKRHVAPWQWNDIKQNR